MKGAKKRNIMWTESEISNTIYTMYFHLAGHKTLWEMCSSALTVVKRQTSDAISIIWVYDGIQVIFDNLFRFHFIVSHFSLYSGNSSCCCCFRFSWTTFAIFSLYSGFTSFPSFFYLALCVILHVIWLFSLRFSLARHTHLIFSFLAVLSWCVIFDYVLSFSCERC